MQIIGGKKYYTVSEAAELAEMSVRTLRRYLAAGQLSDFLFPFRAGPNEILYRMEPPDEDDVKNDAGEWVVRKNPKTVKGGVPDEGISSS